MKLSRTLLPGLVLVAGSALLNAADPVWGVQGALAIPTADLSDLANLGIQGGGHAWWHFQGGHGIMARADLTFYGSKDGVTVNSLGLGADYTYNFEGRAQGVYLLAGASFMHYNFSGYGDSDSRNKLGIDLGVGYLLDRHLGLQLRYTTHDVEQVTLASVNLGVTYSF